MSVVVVVTSSKNLQNEVRYGAGNKLITVEIAFLLIGET